MKTRHYTRAQALQLIPYLEGILVEVAERREAVAHEEEMIRALRPTREVHADEIRDREARLAAERRELRRSLGELEQLGCTLAGTDPLEVHVPGEGIGYGWRPGERFLRYPSAEPSAA